jgi:4-alpha-glucanotransferase
MKRESGILLHITSLPGKFGIGDFGPAAYEFVDFLNQSGQHIWQILPLTVTNSLTGNSPYSSPSAFAINPLLISPELLAEDGYVLKKDIATINVAGAEDVNVNYQLVKMLKEGILKKAYQTFLKKKKQPADYVRFEKDNQYWLQDYANFVVMKQVFGGEDWGKWPMPLRQRDQAETKRFCDLYCDDISFQKFIQYVLFKQWSKLRDYCRKKQIRILGDMPIYVEYDSADVWTHPEYYKLDDQSLPAAVAGVPPDYFSPTGQRWGNPVYNWDALREKRYDWWIERLRYNLNLYDMVRIDHFRGLVQYWEVPAYEETAVNGSWQDVPTYDFFDTVFQQLDKESIVAEDLGFITDDVRNVMNHYNFPGMKILLFAFNGNLDDHPYLPHNISENFLVYTGTHDNNTVRGWVNKEKTGLEDNNLREYIGREFHKEIDYNHVHWDLVEMAFRSRANLAIAPLQDLLGYDETTRMNQPGISQGFWEWRCDHNDFDKGLAQRLKQLTKDTNR